MDVEITEKVKGILGSSWNEIPPKKSVVESLREIVTRYFLLECSPISNHKCQIRKKKIM